MENILRNQFDSYFRKWNEEEEVKANFSFSYAPESDSKILTYLDGVTKQPKLIDLLNANDRKGILNKLTSNKSIFIFDLISDPKLLKEDETLQDGFFLRYDGLNFKLFTENAISGLYILLSYNENTYNLLYCFDNSTVISYSPIVTDDKEIIDKFMDNFFKEIGLVYEPDKDRELSPKQIKFLPGLNQSIWQEDLCIFFLTKFLGATITVEEIDDYANH